MPPALAVIATLAFVGLLLAAALKDTLSFTIPNWISLALIALFPVAAFAVGMPLMTVGVHVGVGVAVLIVGMVMFALRWIGGGDAKLLAAAALWIGWPGFVEFATGAALAGGALAVLLLLMRAPAMRPYVLYGPSWFVRLAEPGEGVPYGVAIAAGACMALPATLFGAALGL